MTTISPEKLTWIPSCDAKRTLDPYIDQPVPDHADCAGLPTRCDYLDGVVMFPANGYPGQDAGVFGYTVVSVCPLCGQWWHWEHKKFTKAGVILDDE